MPVGIYYSPMDWRFPGYFKPKEFRDNAELMKKQCWGQVEELMKNYGKIDVVWWDGAWLAHAGTNEDAAWLWDTDQPDPHGAEIPAQGGHQSAVGMGRGLRYQRGRP